MLESDIRTLFLNIVSTLTIYRDVNMETADGQVLEYGMTIDENTFITYRESNQTLHFYHNDEELLVLDNRNPLLVMFHELFAEVDDGDPADLKRARLRLLD